MEQITIKEIARLCGVGVSTVSRAINNHPDINPETKKKIMDIIQEYDYVPNNSARNLKRTESHTIALMIKGISNPFFGEIIQTFEREVEHQEYSFIPHQVEEHEDELEAAIQLEKEKRLKGIIFLGGLNCRSEASLRRLTVPFVVSTVDMKLPETIEKGAVVSIDHEAESFRLVDNLCRMGHRKIAILAAREEDESIGQSRLRGYERALREHGIEMDPELIIYMKKGLRTYTSSSGYEMTRDLVESGKEFTCVYAISDTMAIGAMRALLDCGLRVPEDVSVAGFDGLEMGRYYCPRLMTISQPREEMARETVHILFDMIKGREVPKQTMLEAQLVPGESVRSIAPQM
ncbi:MAG: LacI family DNA-binding transcriptional regulator [Lachnospiraceae bacterium]|nr:LacI family DNA-binding transcriptional regulator [Lachnospiraceae bacterium]